MVNENFKSLKELYDRVTPALKSKVKELKLHHIPFVTEKEIWECLKSRKWKEESDLTLYDIVNDILFLEEKEIMEYLNQTYEIEEEKIEEKEDKEDTIL